MTGSVIVVAFSMNSETGIGMGYPIFRLLCVMRLPTEAKYHFSALSSVKYLLIVWLYQGFSRCRWFAITMILSTSSP